ncbi:MAG: thioredoxin [Candidatus Moranbacteria bacterium]|nr:thioredoxin [Candidatus Moranbacteria bacterium]
MEVIFTDTNFDEEVLKSDLPVLVDFWAPWCGPCQMMSPVIEDLAKEMEGKAKIGKLNVDENPQKATQYGVMSIPTLKIFKNGEIVKEMTGVQTMEDLKEMLLNIV